MFWATLETVNYRFNAFGLTEEHALEIMRATWEEHARQSGATWTWEDVADGVGVMFTRAGDGLRDFELVVSANQTPRPKAMARIEKPKRESK